MSRADADYWRTKYHEMRSERDEWRAVAHKALLPDPPRIDAQTLRDASETIRNAIRPKSGFIDPRKHFSKLLIAAELDRMANALTENPTDAR